MQKESQNNRKQTMQQKQYLKKYWLDNFPKMNKNIKSYESRSSMNNK